MNPLGDLLRARKDQLLARGDTVRKIAQRGGLIESTVYEHLARRRPFKTNPHRETLEKLAKGFQLAVGDVVEAARNSVGPLKGDPLQLLVRSAQVETGRSARQAVRHAKLQGFAVSEATISGVINATHGELTDSTVNALAAGFDLPVERVREAAAQSKARVSYRLPGYLEDQLTPEKWAKIVKIVEDILTVE